MCWELYVLGGIIKFVTRIVSSLWFSCLQVMLIICVAFLEKMYLSIASKETYILNLYSCTAMAAEQDALQEQNAALKVEEAKAAADRSVDLAIRKRQRAQVLMQNADLATYKAAMAFRIAEAAQVLGSPDAAAVYVLD